MRTFVYCVYGQNFNSKKAMLLGVYETLDLAQNRIPRNKGFKIEGVKAVDKASVYGDVVELWEVDMVYFWIDKIDYFKIES